MVYASRPRKMQRTSYAKRSSSKSRRSRFVAAGPSRTLVPRQSLPEIKRKDYDLNMSLWPVAYACFSTERGTANVNRTGNSINMKAIKIHYDFGLTGIDPAGGTQPHTDKTLSLYLVRDVEAHAAQPLNVNEWQTALFADPLHSKWNLNFRNTDYVDRFQIVKKIDVPTVAANKGLVRSDGYMSLDLNGVQAKYETNPGTGEHAPINVRYYVVWNFGGLTFDTATVRVREEWTDN